MSKLFENQTIEYIAKKNYDNLPSFLEGISLSGRLFRRLYKGKSILVNGKFQRKDLEIKEGDRIAIVLEDEEDNTEPEKIDLNIVYEDLDLLIINKEPNMVVHQTKSHQNATLSNGIAYYFKENNIKRKIRLVNRLDMDTSGLLIVAKNSFAHQQLALQLEANTVVKKYKALVKGQLEQESGLIDSPIGREANSIKKLVLEDGQEALTQYRLLESYKNASLLDVQIFTGRSHQIRVHLNEIGHPIIGDSLYDQESDLIGRQALHAYYLEICHPRTGERIEFIAALPKDMEDLISNLSL